VSATPARLHLQIARPTGRLRKLARIDSAFSLV
jgi:hypothetical protein